jgi:hypothetical protein
MTFMAQQGRQLGQFAFDRGELEMQMLLRPQGAFDQRLTLVIDLAAVNGGEQRAKQQHDQTDGDDGQFGQDGTTALEPPGQSKLPLRQFRGIARRPIRHVIDPWSIVGLRARAGRLGLAPDDRHWNIL